MRERRKIYRPVIALLLCLLQTAGIAVYGQNHPRAASKRMHHQQNDSLYGLAPSQTDSLNKKAIRADFARFSMSADSLAVADSLAIENSKRVKDLAARPELNLPSVPTDSQQRAVSRKEWKPNPTKATWLGLVIPGGGQIYNRKFWKLPIFYGGFAGCAYALTWNNKMYKDYSAAYKDAANGNWNSTSITDLLPPNYKYSQSQLTEVLRKRKDTYRRYRDLSIFAFIGVYLLSVVDAYVDAELSNFDIGPDLSMRVEPAVMDSRMVGSSSRTVGVQCSFRF